MSPPRTPSPRIFRAGERHLLIVVALALSAGFLTLFCKRMPSADGFTLDALLALAPLVACLGAIWIMHMALVLTGSHASPLLLPGVVLLAGLGVMLRYRSGAAFDVTSLSVLAYPLGAVAMLTAAVAFRRNGSGVLARFGWVAWLLSIALMGALLVLGTRFRGAVFASGNMTPTEVLKPLMVIFIAAWLAPNIKAVQKEGGLVPEKGLGLFVAAWMLLMVLLLKQRDLGMMLMLNATLLMMCYAASANVNVLITGGALVSVAAVAAAFVPHVQGRFVAWLAPWEEPTGAGWQILQALSALYSGGMLGSGLGEGEPQAIPVSSSDFIYASLGEEMGYIGCGLVILCYLLIWRECFHIAGSRKDPFERLLGIGLVSLLAIQTLLNVGGVTKALPVTGVPLPFISHGGTNFIVAMFCMGLIMALSDDTRARAIPLSPRRRPKKRKSSRQRKRPAKSSARKGSAKRGAAKRKPTARKKR